MFDKKRFCTLLAIFLVSLLIMPTAAFAAAFGQIKGTITDAETGEPVVNASVLVVGTKFGNFTDLDGKYIIPRLDPGTYTIKISSIEYNTVEVTDVVVNADLTTEVSQKLTKKVSDLDKTIKVVGTHDVIDRFETENKLTITSETIKNKPVQTVDALLEQVAGVLPVKFLSAAAVPARSRTFSTVCRSVTLSAVKARREPTSRWCRGQSRRFRLLKTVLTPSTAMPSAVS